MDKVGSSEKLIGENRESSKALLSGISSFRKTTSGRTHEAMA